MLRRIISVFAIFLLLSCGEEVKVDPECEAASQAAKEYYSYLTEGKSEEFVNGFSRVNLFPVQYRNEFSRNTEDFLQIQHDRHGGIAHVDVSSAERDSVNNTINVFLSICYGDSTQSRIVVPMIKNNDKWQMK